MPLRLPSSLRERLTRSRVDVGCFIAVCLLPIIVNLPALLIYSPDPLAFVSGLNVAGRHSALPGIPWIDPNAGFTIQALGGASANDWLHGVVPWWNPLMSVGVPLAGEMQPASFFLPFVLLLYFQNGVLFLKIVLQILAAAATYLFLRQIQLRPFAAFAGSVLYSFNGTFAWFTDMPTMPLPFLPLFLLGVEKAWAQARAGLGGGWVVLAIALAFSLYAGFPETAFLNGLFVLLWALCRLVLTKPGARLAFSRKVIIGGAAGLLLALPILFPFIEYLSLSGVDHAHQNEIGLPKFGLALLLFPYIYGPIEAFELPNHILGPLWGSIGGFVDLLSLCLALSALVTKRLSIVRWTLVAWLAVFLARTLNVPKLGAWLGVIPFIGETAVYRYVEPSCAMAVAILIALALNDWQNEERPRWATWSSVASFLLLGTLGVYLAWKPLKFLLKVPRYPVWFWSSLLLPSVLLAVIAFLFTRRDKRAPILVTSLIALNAIALFTIPELSGRRGTQLDFSLPRFLQSHAGLARTYTFGTPSPNYPSYFGFANINYNALPIPANWLHYVLTSLDPGTHPILFIGSYPPFEAREEALRTHLANFEAIGVRYVVAPHQVNPFLPAPASQPPAETPKQIFNGITGDVYELPHPAPYFEAVSGTCTLSIESRQAVRASCSAPAQLIRRELFYPGWHAFVNGRETSLTNAPPLFQAIRLPKGESKISFAYWPSYIGLALCGALLGLLLLAAGLQHPF